MSILEDGNLDALLQGVVIGVTGLSGSLVRPRWQPVVPKQPEPTVDWCAIGVVEETPDDGPAIMHSATGGVGGNGFDTLIDHEEVMVFVSFYGPNAGSNIKLLRDGLAIPQNTEVLLANQLRFIACGSVRTVPELINQQWLMRKDMTIDFRRKVTRTYDLENVLIGDVNLFDDTTVNDTIIVPNGSTIQP